MSAPLGQDGPDTALARILLKQGALSVGELQEALAEVRRERSRSPGASLAGSLLSRGRLSGAQLEEAHGLLVAEAGPEGRPEAPPPAQRFGPYGVLRELARGGMGAVYEVEHEATRVRYALKTILPADPGPDEEQERARFRREAESMARLDHPHVARIFSADLLGRSVYLVQELLTGGTLEERVLQGRLSDAEVGPVVEALAEGLGQAHAAGILHRDLKPQNVLFSAEGVPKLVDFGLAYTGQSSRNLTATGSLLGTPAYMAPEQALGQRDFDQRVDVYGLGGVLYFALCGYPPFGGGLFETLEQVIHRPPEPPSARRAGVSPALEAICLKALAKDPADRYGEMRELAEALRAAGEGEGRAARRAPALAVSVSLSLLGTAALGGALFYASRSSSSGLRPQETQQALRPLGSGGGEATSPTLSPSRLPSPAPQPGFGSPGPLGPPRGEWEAGPGALVGYGCEVVVCGGRALTLELPYLSGHTLKGAEAYQSQSSAVRVWDVERGEELHVLELGSFAPLAMALSPDERRLALAGAAEVRIYETATWTEVQRLERTLPGQAARDLAFSPSGGKLALTSGAPPHAAEVWSLAGGRLVSVVPGPRSALAFQGEDALAFDYAQGRGEELQQGFALWDLARGAERYRCPLTLTVVDLRVSPGGELLLAGGWGAGDAGEQISLCELERGVVRASLKTARPINRLALNPTWTEALALSGAEEVVRFSLPDLQVQARGQSQGHHDLGAALLGDGRSLVVGCDRRLRLLGSDLKPLWKQRALPGPILGLFPGADAPIVGTSGGLVPLPPLDAAEAPWLAVVGASYPGAFQCFAMAPEVRRVWIATKRQLSGYDLLLGSFVYGQGRVDADVACLAAQGAGAELLVAFAQQAPILHGRLAAGKIRWRRLEDPTGGQAPHSTALLIAGKHGFSGDRSGTLRCWDLTNDTLSESAPDPPGLAGREPAAVVSLCFAQGRLCAGMADGRIRRWRPGYAELRVLAGHKGPVLALCALPEGRLASAGRDGSLVIWDLRRGEVLQRVEFAPGDAPAHLAYAEGKLLVGSLRGAVREYPCK